MLDIHRRFISDRKADRSTSGDFHVLIHVFDQYSELGDGHLHTGGANTYMLLHGIGRNKGFAWAVSYELQALCDSRRVAYPPQNGATMFLKPLYSSTTYSHQTSVYVARRVEDA